MAEFKRKEGLTTAVKTFYGVGDGGFVLMSNVETFYFMKCMTNQLGFTATEAGVVNSVFSIVDACLSWVYGMILNGTRPKKYGRYRSWLVIIPWIVPFLFAFQFLRLSENPTVAGAIIAIAAIVSHFCWNLCYVANNTMVSVIGRTPEERGVVASGKALWNNVGSLLFSYLGLPFATLLGGIVGEKNQFAACAFVLGIVMVLTYFVHFKISDGYEEPEDEATIQAKKLAEQNKMSVGQMFAMLIKHPIVIMIMIADLAKWCVNFVTKGAAAYFWEYGVADPSKYTQYQTTYALLTSIAGILGAYCARYVVKKVSTRLAVLISLGGMAVFLLGVYFLYSSATTVMICITLAFFFYGMALGSFPGLYADTVVMITAKEGKNPSGWIMGLQNVPLKIGVFLRGVIIAASLNAAHWTKGVVFEGAERQGMAIPFGLVPAIFCIVGFVLILVAYKTTKEDVAKAQAEIDARTEGK
ncbi:MAG: MFS transporter [Firmicutes bacterium]|nr:MFS transporter [Bacillota bacterium]